MPRQKYITDLFLCWTQKNGRRRTSSPSINFTGSKSRNLASMFDRNRLWRALVSKWSNISEI